MSSMQHRHDMAAARLGFGGELVDGTMRPFRLHGARAATGSRVDVLEHERGVGSTEPEGIG
jgi:hypothetical protein